MGIIFYNVDGMIVGVDRNWDQERFVNIVDLFEILGFKTNGAKNEAMVCIPRFLWDSKGEDF